MPTPTPAPPPIVRVKGSHRAMGQQLGEALKSQILHSRETARGLIEHPSSGLNLKWDGAIIQAQKYLPYAQERYPQYVDEIAGIAEGSDVPFIDLFVLTTFEAVTSDALQLGKCTSIAVNDDRTTNGHVLIAHNEDWTPEDEQDVALVHATPDEEPPFLAMMYGGYLPNIGFNACGIAQCCDSAHPSDSRTGLPRVILSRAVLGTRTIADAIRCMVSPRRAAGYNHLLAHESGELYCVEVSARRFAVLYAHEGIIVHTNHYLDVQLQAVEKNPDELLDTRVRRSRALNLLKLSVQHNLESLQAIQRDHVNLPNAICNHDQDNNRWILREKTICALVMDLNTRAMHIAWGNPCQNPYHTFFLEP